MWRESGKQATWVLRGPSRGRACVCKEEPPEQLGGGCSVPETSLSSGVSGGTSRLRQKMKGVNSAFKSLSKSFQTLRSFKAIFESNFIVIF